ncbi:MAG: hypothetical protein J6Y37_14795 [Paludibacteraceae bacterium]|nr:hypothetical protein [Paludibacteraceae bacterium]
MACNCATQEQINELYKRYGRDRKKSNLTFKEKAKNVVVYTGVVIAMIPIVPCLFLYVLYKAVCDDDKRISLTKFFRLDRKKVAGYVG